MAKALMIQGTSSGAGKSLITAAFCRIFRDKGVSVAPFKGQNMALNSYITREGGEIGRAQALQAEAARVVPSVDMNPVLLKASGEAGAQVIVHGKVLTTMKARQYYAYKKEAWEAVKASYSRLSKGYDLIVIEGAGSPAEINLLNVDIVNMAVARLAKAPVILVGDIDRGGVFASLFGTIKLLGRESRRIKAFIINRFRGDLEILRPGLAMIGEKTGKPVAGVIPYITDIGLPEEDGLALQQRSARGKQQPEKKIKIVVLRLNYISNFTDFDPLSCEPDVELIYSRNPADIEHADLVIVPGTKNTVKDLISLREQGLDESLRRAHERDITVVGLCGGYQMLGQRISDPHGIESSHRAVEGIGLLDIGTVFKREKTTCQVEAECVLDPDVGKLTGYEIHMGESTGEVGLFRVTRLNTGRSILDGSSKANCWGTYIHGIFDNDALRRMVLNRLRMRKGLPPSETVMRYADAKEQALDNLAGVIREHVDMDIIEGMVGL